MPQPDTRNSGNHTLTEIRQQLFLQGYQILPNHGRPCLYPRWSTPGYVAHELTDGYRKQTALERIATWPWRFANWRTTGVRLTNGLGVLDFDVDDETVMGAMYVAIGEVAPQILNAPARMGSGTFRAALFVRIEGEQFVRLDCRKYRHGEQEHCIEIFGGKLLRNGNVSRQFGIYGPHSYKDDGTVAIEYAWTPDLPALHEVALTELPTLTKAQGLEIITRFEALADAAGWQRVEEPNTSNSNAVYDITDDSRFNTDKGGVQLTYTELCEEQAIHNTLRCASSFMATRSGEKTNRCWVFWHEARECVAVYVYGDEQTHFPADLGPPQEEELQRAIGKLLQEEQKSPPKKENLLPEDMPPQPRNLTEQEQRDDTEAGIERIAERVIWLLKTHSFENGQIVDVYQDALSRHPSGIMERAARTAWLNWQIIREGKGPKGGTLPPISAFNAWLRNEYRLRTAGYEMRPDQPFPVFAEAGRLWRNRYVMPRHWETAVTRAQITEARDLINALVRNIAAAPEETNYVLQHLSYKMQHPEVPGCAILFVNPVFGSGRDLFYAIAASLLGEANCTKQEIAKLIGKDGRMFNAWVANRVLAYVPEVLDPEHSRSSYERLKSLVDPRSGQVSVNIKGVEEYDGRRYASVWFATNHTDALRLEDDDRRFSVLYGAPQTLDEKLAVRCETWRADPVNIAALWHYLKTIDLSKYKPHVPLKTAAKLVMIDAAKDPIRRALQMIVADKTRRWCVFTLEQLESEVETMVGLNQGSYGDKARNLSSRQKNARAGLVVPVPSTTEYGHVIKLNGKPVRLYCFRADAERAGGMSNEELKAAMPHAEVTALNLGGNVFRLPGTSGTSPNGRSEDEQE